MGCIIFIWPHRDLTSVISHGIIEHHRGNPLALPRNMLVPTTGKSKKQIYKKKSTFQRTSNVSIQLLRIEEDILMTLK